MWWIILGIWLAGMGLIIMFFMGCSINDSPSKEESSDRRREVRKM